MSSDSNDSNKPSLPLEEIQSFDASKLHHQNEVSDKTGVNDHDKMLSAVEGGKLNEHLKHVDENDAKIKQWKPTQVSSARQMGDKPGEEPMIGKKVERNMVFIFLLESFGSHLADCTLGQN